MSKEKTVKVGVLGCGMISEIYMTNISRLFKEIEVIGVYDRFPEAAEKRAKQFELKNCYGSYEEMLSDSEIDVILNLTIPLVHYDTTKQAILAGKHVYTEKPLAATFKEARELVQLAKAQGVRLGSSPDVPLGSGVQTCRKLVDDGYIGRVVGASANLIKRGVETWHPNPDFLYQPGAGPLMDMGPYYLGAMLQIMGPAVSVSGMSSISFKTRTITSQPRYGETIQVNVPTYVNALINYESGAMGTFTATFDVHKASLPFIEIYGSEGTLTMPDPNVFGGPVQLYRPEKGEFIEFPMIFGYEENSRGLGLADMCKAIISGRDHRANAGTALHVLEMMDGILQSAEKGARYNLETSCSRPAPMAMRGLPGVLDD